MPLPLRGNGSIFDIYSSLLTIVLGSVEEGRSFLLYILLVGQVSSGGLIDSLANSPLSPSADL